MSMADSPKIGLDETHLNFFNGFEYDPTPEAEAMIVDGRGGLQGGLIRKAHNDDRELATKKKRGAPTGHATRAIVLLLSALEYYRRVGGNRGSGEPRLVHRPNGPVYPLRPPSPFHSRHRKLQLSYRIFSGTFSFLCFQVEIMALRYLLGLSTTTFVVVGLCKFECPLNLECSAS